MPESDRELIKRCKQLLGGNQQTVARRLEVTPSAISNWLAANRIPNASRKKVLLLLDKLSRGQPVDLPEAAHGPAPTPEEPAGRDVQHCGFWAESAWCFNYLVPSQSEGEPADDQVWRTWNGVHAVRTTTFRHYFRYQILGQKRPAQKGPSRLQKSALRTSADKDAALESALQRGDMCGFGFLKDWSPPYWEHVEIQHTPIEYLNASIDLSPGDHGCAGYYVKAERSILSQTDGAKTYEFVGFRPECPVRELHLVLSLPRELRGAGPMVAYLMSTDYPQYYDFASRIATNQGELDRFIEPWGRVVPVDRLRPEQLQEWGKTEMWARAVGETDVKIITKIAELFQSLPGRDISIATVAAPPSLTTLLMFWPLPQRR